VDLTVGAIPGYFSTMEIERRLLERRAVEHGPSAGDYERNDTIASLTMGVASLLVPLVTHAVADRIAPQRSKIGKGLVALAAGAAVATTIADRRGRKDVSRITGPAALAAGGIATTSAFASATRPKRLWRRRRARDLGTGALATLAAIAAWDFIYYWNHRIQHEARYMWAIHVVHHSSERLNLSTALRQPVADSLGTFVPYGVLCLAGIRPALVERARQINLLYQYWIHTDLIRRLGPLERVLNTPSHHRVHHGSNRRYIDRNHGSILIVWDRLFGTFQREEDDEPVVYGLTKNIETFNPARIASHEYVDMWRDVADSTNWSDRLSFVARGPGWAYARRAEHEQEAAV
jgi:sterol desaturase/sphingolipid hydroxylase (fatty acid hydroxylase superfamily)